jgi:hypothetical protein
MSSLIPRNETVFFYVFNVYCLLSQAVMLLFRLGNYQVLEKLYQYLPEARAAKAHLGRASTYLLEHEKSPNFYPTF